MLYSVALSGRIYEAFRLAFQSFQAEFREGLFRAEHILQRFLLLACRREQLTVQQLGFGEMVGLLQALEFGGGCFQARLHVGVIFQGEMRRATIKTVSP